MHTIRHTQKRVLFLLGIIVTSIAGIVADRMSASFSKSDSLVIPTAHADYANYVVGGDGCGGCSGDSSY